MISVTRIHFIANTSNKNLCRSTRLTYVTSTCHLPNCMQTVVSLFDSSVLLVEIFFMNTDKNNLVSCASSLRNLISEINVYCSKLLEESSRYDWQIFFSVDENEKTKERNNCTRFRKVFVFRYCICSVFSSHVVSSAPHNDDALISWCLDILKSIFVTFYHS